MEEHMQKLYDKRMSSYHKKFDLWYVLTDGGEDGSRIAPPRKPYNPLHAMDPIRDPEHGNWGYYHERNFTNLLDRFRCVGAVRFPTFNPRANEIENGYRCLACGNAYDIWQRQEMHPYLRDDTFVHGWAHQKKLQYRAMWGWSRDGILGHFEECHKNAGAVGEDVV
jgi:hypothetical protein